MIFFKDFNLENWYETEERYYNLGLLHFDPLTFLHTIDKNLMNSSTRQIIE